MEQSVVFWFFFIREENDTEMTRNKKEKQRR